MVFFRALCYCNFCKLEVNLSAASVGLKSVQLTWEMPYAETADALPLPGTSRDFKSPVQDLGTRRLSRHVFSYV